MSNISNTLNYLNRKVTINIEDRKTTLLYRDLLNLLDLHDAVLEFKDSCIRADTYCIPIDIKDINNGSSC